MEDITEICEHILEKQCAKCVYKKNNKNDCPYHKNIIKPIAVYRQDPDNWTKKNLRLFVKEDPYTNFLYCNIYTQGENK